MNKTNRSFDIIVYGATSFVGQILTEYLGNYSNNQNSESVSWAIAGRSESKLLDLKSRLNLSELAHFVADASDLDGLSELANKKTRRRPKLRRTVCGHV